MSTEHDDSQAGTMPGLDPTQPATAPPAKPKRTRSPKAKTVDGAAPDKAGAAKPKRTPASPKAKAAQTTDTPTPPEHAPTSQPTPRITNDAIDFLANPDASAADLFKLSPEGQTFVKYHLSNMAQQDASSQRHQAYLLANRAPVSPAFQQFADALVKRGKAAKAPVQTPDAATPGADVHAIHGAQPGLPSAAAIVQDHWQVKWERVDDLWTATCPGIIGMGATREQAAREFLVAVRKGAGELPQEAIHLLDAPTVDQAKVSGERPAGLARPNYLPAAAPFYGAKSATSARPAPVSVELRKLEIAPTAPAQATQAAKASPDEMTRASIIIATSHYLMSAPIDDITPQEAADMVQYDTSALSGIKNARSRQLALNAIAESSHAQPRYRVQLVRQAPDVLEAALAANHQTYREQGLLSSPAAKEPENSIEPGPAVKSKDLTGQEAQPTAPSSKTEGRPAPDPLPRPGVGKRLMQALGAAAVKVGTRLAEQGKGDPAPTATPVSLDKPGVATAIPATPATAAPIMPEAVARRFMNVGKDYYFDDKTHAFSDRGNKLATRGHHPEVVRALVEVARARGWDSITVKGTDEFRRGAWLEAAQNGLKVAGYQPTALDLADLAQRPARNTVEPASVQQKASQAVPDPTAQQAAQDAARVTPAQPTTSVQAGPQWTAPTAGKPDPALAAMAKSFEKDKPTFVVKKYPELAAGYGLVEAARAFAVEKLPESAHDEFVGLARRHVMQQILTGQQVHGPKIHLAPAKAKDAGQAQESADLGKPARAKEPARER